MTNTHDGVGQLYQISTIFALRINLYFTHGLARARHMVMGLYRVSRIMVRICVSFLVTIRTIAAFWDRRPSALRSQIVMITGINNTEHVVS